MDYLLIEEELVRQRLYEDILYRNCLYLFPELGEKEIYHILLRYIFNKNITKKDNDDPVFITSKSEIAEQQLKEDYNYFNSVYNFSNTFDFIKNKIEYNLQKCSKSIFLFQKMGIKNTEGFFYRVYVKDFKIYFIKTKRSSSHSEIYTVNDYKNLSRINIYYAFVLNVRYNYLKLTTHGLSRNYTDFYYLNNFNNNIPKDYLYKNELDVLEGFANPFNNYFTNYCSAFPDLENIFNSKGSFFDVNLSDYKLVYINPPFDIKTVEKII